MELQIGAKLADQCVISKYDELVHRGPNMKEISISFSAFIHQTIKDQLQSET